MPTPETRARLTEGGIHGYDWDTVWLSDTADHTLGDFAVWHSGAGSQRRQHQSVRVSATVWTVTWNDTAGVALGESDQPAAGAAADRPAAADGAVPSPAAAAARVRTAAAVAAAAADPPGHPHPTRPAPAVNPARSTAAATPAADGAAAAAVRSSTRTRRL